MVQTQAARFDIGDQIRTYNWDGMFIACDIEVRQGRTRYHIEETFTPWLEPAPTCWTAHDELRPVGNR